MQSLGILALPHVFQMSFHTLVPPTGRKLLIKVAPVSLGFLIMEDNGEHMTTRHKSIRHRLLLPISTTHYVSQSITQAFDRGGHLRYRAGRLGRSYT